METKPTKGSTTEALMSLLEEELLAADDRELDVILQELGLDPAEAVAKVDAVFKVALKADAARRLTRAREVRAREVNLLGGSEAGADLGHAQLFELVKLRSASMQGTLLHRDFSEATAEDLRSILRQIDALEKAKGKG